MPQRKRPYVPKRKGCYECSQRRIDCDRTHPTCRKCAVKGIACSGFGVSWRFRNSFTPGTKKSKRSSCSAKDQSHSNTNSTSTPKSDPESDERDTQSSISESPPMDISRDHVSRAFSAVSPGKRFLLNYFSQNIAPEMVVVDDINNGWRHMVLQMAHRDDLVMNAVLAASSFHFSSRRASGPQDAAKLYTRAIRELQKKRTIDKYDLETQHSIILAILVLLVALMVNGSSDFPIVFQMLRSALVAIGGDSKLREGELPQFLLRQIHKMRVYGAPFISQDAGTCTLIFEGKQSFDCLEYYRNLYPNYFDSFDRIVSLRQQAYDIYLYRASLGDDGAPSTHLVENFISTLEEIPEGSLGEHSLIWPCFIAASESHSPEDQLFFDNFLRRQFSRSGFVNVLRALDLLKKIWAKQKHENWTKMLPEPQVFIM